MSIEKVRQHLKQWNREGDILKLSTSTATVPLAAQALGVEPGRIAKSISLVQEGGVLVLVVAGDVKIDNRKFKDTFGFKAKMLSPDNALRLTGHAVGGVCPFALPPEAVVFLDISLKRFPTVFPACGVDNSAIELTMDELAIYSSSKQWVDVCRLPEPLSAP